MSSLAGPIPLVILAQPRKCSTPSPSMSHARRSYLRSRNGSMRVLQAKSDDLWGDWEDLGEMRHANGDRLTNYDGHAFRHPNGKRYL